MSWSHNLSSPAALRYGHALAVVTAVVAAGGAMLMIGVMLDARAPADVALQSSNSTARPISPVATGAAAPDRLKIAMQANEPVAPAAPNNPALTDQQKVATQATEPTTSAPVAGPIAQKPVFDVLRVEPDGEAVIAGHASANAVLELRADSLVVAEAKADRLGDFTMSPPPFAAGPHRLELSVKAGVGPAAVSDPVTLEVPAREARAASTPPPTQQVAAMSETEATPATSSTDASPSVTGSSKPDAKSVSPIEGVTIVARTPMPPPRPNFESLPTKYSEAGPAKRGKAQLASLPALGLEETRGGGHATSR
ncbi:MAG TPA: hypothetical protein VEK35_11035 [Roseiarcus sp.]|nr:hypothetical protein [Roseiarcus sp.]